MLAHECVCFCSSNTADIHFHAFGKALIKFNTFYISADARVQIQSCVAEASEGHRPDLRGGQDI